MKTSFFNSCFLIIVTILTSFSFEADIYYNHTSLDNNLYFVFSTFRHGAREPFVDVDYFGNKIQHKGALTNYGAIQHLEIGKKYRERYSNFLNMSFDPNQMYIRSTDVERTVISTLKELEGLFGRVIDKKYLQILSGGANFWNLFQLNNTEHAELDQYFAYCKNKKRILQSFNEIFPILKECYGATNYPETYGFCDSVFTAYFKYTYENDTENKIGKCGKENADKLHQFCFNLCNTYKGWDERAAYMFYILYQHIFEYMVNAVEGNSNLKMLMMGGHDITVDKFMDFLNGLNIIPRTHYPHYACNIVIELRKYSDEFYLEFYYNDILKYNETFQTFADTLDNSKYSNLYNFCGIPPGKPAINNTKITIPKPTTTGNIDEIIPTQKEEIITNKPIISPTSVVEETTKKIELIPTQKIEVKETTQKEIIPPTQKIEEQTAKIDIIPPTQKMEVKETTQKEIIPPTQKIEEQTTKIDIIPPTQKIEIIETTKKEENPPSQKMEATVNIQKTLNNQISMRETEKIKETEEEKETLINNEFKSDLSDIIENQELIHRNSTFQKAKIKLKQFFKQDSDLNLYIILISIIVTIIAIIFFACLLRYLAKRRRKFIRLTEEQSKKGTNNANNLSVLSIDNRKDEKKK